MIILLDKNIPRAKFLMPIHKKEWRTPSTAQLKDQLNNENRTLFGITARLSDGYIKWRGIFEDRDDFDAFLFAIANDTLRYERTLWDLPNFRWDPEFSIGTVYEFQTYSYITTPNNGTNGTYNIPFDWNNSNNSVRGIGGGGSGSSVTSTGVTAHAQGGSAGEYRRITNFTSTHSGQPITYQIGRASASTGIVQSTNFIAVSSIAAGATTWNTSSLIANPGVAGAGSTTTSGLLAALNGGSGGTGAGGNFNGGGCAALSNNGSASGGAGAGGTTGSGNPNATIAATNTSGNGGAGGTTDGGSAGVAAGATGGVGGNGTGFEGVAGAGGGGAGAQASDATAIAGNGGNYGSGGGGAAVRNVSANRQATGGNGIAGIIVVSYEPIIQSLWRNMPMLGM